MWAPVLVAAAACYAIKLSGLSLPQRFLQDRAFSERFPSFRSRCSQP